MNIVYSTAGDKLGTAAKPWAEVHGITVLAGGVALAKVTRPLDQFGTPSDNTDLDATTARHDIRNTLDRVREEQLKELRQMHELTVRMVKYHGLDNETGPICGGPKDGR